MKRVLHVGLCLLTATCVAGVTIAASATDLESILKQHEDAIGGHDAISAVTSVASYATIEFMGLNGKSSVQIEFPYKYLVGMDIGAMSQQKGYDGITAWNAGPNGIVREDIAEEIKPMINELYFGEYSYLLAGRIPGRVEYRGDTLIDAERHYTLAMFPDGGDSMLAYINALTGLVDYRVDITTGVKTTSFYSDYRLVKGVRVPFFSETTITGAPYAITAWVDSVIINPDIPDSIFSMPGVALEKFSFPTGQNSIVVPISLEGEAAYVAVQVNGRGPFMFLLDSGAGRTVLSANLAKELGVLATGKVPARGVGGYGEMQFGQLDSLRIGQLSWNLSRITVFDFAEVAAGLSDIRGILGYDFFARFPIRIDFDREEMTIFDPKHEMPDQTGIGIPFEVYCDLPVMEVMLDGAPVRVAFDLGARMSMEILTGSRWYKKRGEKYAEGASQVTIAGVGGTDNALMARVDSLYIGSVGIDDVEVIMASQATAFPFPDYIEGLLGMGVMQRFNLFIDYPNRLIHLEKRGGKDK